MNISSTLNAVLSYSWKKRNTVVAGENNSKLNLHRLLPSHNGTQYICNYFVSSDVLIRDAKGCSDPHLVIVTGT